ncbi:MAG: hypothetical protein WB441_02755 [Nocardioidaceae bacterium]
MAPGAVLARAGLAHGERVLAAVEAVDGSWLLGTRDALLLLPSAAPSPTRVAWETVSTAGWDRDAERLTVVRTAEFGRPRPVHAFDVAEPGRLLPMIRERVTASVLLQRRVVVRDRLGLTVVARRSPHQRGPVSWGVDLDPGLDPLDPVVRATAEEAVRAAEQEMEPGPRTVV